MATLKRFTVINRSLKSKAPAQYSITGLADSSNKLLKIVNDPFPLNAVTTKTTRTNYGIGGNPFVGSYKTPGLQAEISMQIISQPAAEISIQVFRNQSSNTRIIRPGR